MSVKETIHQWIDEMPDNSPTLLDFYERMGNTGPAWVDALYRKLLNRTAVAGEESDWLQKLAAGQ